MAFDFFLSLSANFVVGLLKLLEVMFADSEARVFER